VYGTPKARGIVLKSSLADCRGTVNARSPKYASNAAATLAVTAGSFEVSGYSS